MLLDITLRQHHAHAGGDHQVVKRSVPQLFLRPGHGGNILVGKVRDKIIILIARIADFQQRSQLLRCKPSGKFMLHPPVVQSENLEGLPGTEYKIRLDPYRAVLSVQFIERELLRRH